MTSPKALPSRLFPLRAKVHGPIVQLFIAILFASLAGSAAFAATTLTWSGGTSTAWDWATGGNWVGGVAPTSDLVTDIASFGGSTFTNQPSLTLSGSIAGIAVTSGLATNLTIGGAYTLSIGSSGIADASTSDSLTISDNVDVAAAQTWSAGTGSAGYIQINGNLTDSNNITLSGGYSSTGAGSLPTFRLMGSDSSYTGTIGFTGGVNSGILLGSASAMTGGLIDLSDANSGAANLYLTGGAGSSTDGSGTYTFGINGATTTGARVNFRGGGAGQGIYLTGGNVYWDPGNGATYDWSGSTDTTIDIGGGSYSGATASAPNMLYLGNSTTGVQFQIAGANKTFLNTQAGNTYPYGAIVTLESALADGNDGTQRTLSTQLGLLVLTQAAVNNSSTKPLIISVTGKNGDEAALDIGATNELTGGELSLGGGSTSPGVLVLDNLSWDTFAAGRANGTANGDYNVGVGGGFAARGTAITIDTNSTTTSTFAVSNLTLGAPVLNTNGTLWANAGVTISQGITYGSSTAQTITASGGSSLSAAGIYTISGPIMQLSGVLTGNSASGTTLTLQGGGGGSGNAVPIFELSNAGNTKLNISTASGGGTGYGILLATSDAVFGGGTLTVNASTPGGSDQSGWLIEFAGYTSSENIAFSSAASNLLTTGWGLGAYSGNAVYEGTSTITNADTTDSGAKVPLNWDVESGATLALGASGGTAATFVNNMGQSKIALYRKTGSGTLILNNVTYSGTSAGGYQFAIQNGALQETGNTTANSTTGAYITLSGGVLETNNTFESGGFTRTASTTAGATNINMNAGGGFSAYGGALTVNLGGASAAQTWNVGGFVSTGNALDFGSQTANNVVTFVNPISLNGAVRTISVIGTGLSNEAILSGALTTTSGGVNKTGSGVLNLSNSGDNYTGATTVTAGTLIVSGGLTGTVTPSVLSGATLEVDGATVNTAATVSVTGGTVQGAAGTVGAVNISSGGNLAPGYSLGSTAAATLTAGNVSFLDTASTFSIRLGVASATDNDQLKSTGTVTLDNTPLNLTLGSAFSSATVGNTYVIINGGASATGSGTDVFSYGGTAIANDATFTTSGGDIFEVQYNVSGSDELVFEGLAAIPEPGTWASMLGGFGLLLVAQQARRRTRRAQ